jgi:hypothetical protein
VSVPLVSLDDVKVHLPIRANVTEYDSRLSMLILTATRQIETAVEREFHAAAREEIFGTPDTVSYGYDFAGTTNESGILQRSRPARYALKTLNITPATLEVFYDASGEFAADTKVDAKNIVLDKEKGHLTVTFPMRRTVAGLKVVYTGGYESAGSPASLSASIPIDVKMACISQVLFLHTRMDAMNVGRTSEKKEGEGANMFSVSGGLTPEASALLGRYRAMRMSLD